MSLLSLGLGCLPCCLYLSLSRSLCHFYQWIDVSTAATFCLC